ncbi:MAG: MBL fold metallo-hydrolase [Steroidobacteraceae bacterium]|nr:MBL fold metallo-hydrolase [Steroidobacteraceae bacterium]MDW8259715.1 MBL fold metallo-hydrolase [Gammaproteobacteria bacterium]
MQLEFFGAAGEVTGSCHILRVGGRVLLLDCGLIQGGRDAPLRNRRPFPFDPSAVDAVLLSHAHIDHCGRLPLLVKRGFRGPIFTNSACAELLPILLYDAADLMLRDAERNRHRDFGGDDRELLEPLFEREHVDATLRRIRTVPYDKRIETLPGVQLRVRDAGHIMGSSSLELWLTEGELRRKLVFSGDLGQYGSPILEDPHAFDCADLVLMESTYGGREHRDRATTEAELGGVLEEAWRARGNVIIPAFAIGRSQDLLYLFGKYFDRWQMARWKIVLDSPMAIEASRIYWKYPEHYDQEARRLRRDFERLRPLPNLQLCRTAEESRAINALRSGAVVIAGSGMCNGGRVLHHLRHNLERPECHVVITGFQAPGTLGRQLVDRAATVRSHGTEIRVAASVHTLGGLSAHGGQKDLLRWYGSFRDRPPVYLVHGEPAAAGALQQRLQRSGANATVTWPGLTVDLAALPALAHDH